MHQLQNKPWAAFYVLVLLFMLISLGVLAFYAIQQVAQACLVQPCIHLEFTKVLPLIYLPGSVIIFYYILLSCGFHLNHLIRIGKDGVTELGHVDY